MTAEDAIRYLDFRARECRDKEAHEALCLLLPALLKVFNLPEMDSVEAEAVRFDLRRSLCDHDGLSRKPTVQTGF